MSGRFRPETWCFLSVWAFLATAGRTRLLRDPGTFWHTSAGEWMLENRAPLRVDLFSAEHYGKEWIPLQWLSECLMAAVFRLGGLDLQFHAAIWLLAGTFAWIFSRLLREHWHWLPAATAVFLTLWAGSYHFHVRPHLFTIFFVGWTYAMLADVERGAKPMRRLLWLPAVFVLWVNLHPGAYAGIAMTLAACGVWIACRVLAAIWPRFPVRGPIGSGGDLAVIVVCAATICLTPLVNPYGWDLPRAAFSVLDSPVVRVLIVEHSRMNLLDPAYIGVLLLAAFYGWTLFRADWRQAGVTWIFPALLFAMSLQRVRHGPLFAVTAVIALGVLTRNCRWLRERVTDAAAVSPTENETPSEGEKAKPTRNALMKERLRTACLLAGVVGLTVTVNVMEMPVPVIGNGWAQPHPNNAPMAILSDLQALSQNVPQGTAILNDLNYGGFVIRYAPKLKVTIDDRCELYDDKELSEYWAMMTRPDRWKDFMKKHDAKAAITRSTSRLAVGLTESPDWVLVASGDGASLFVKRGEAAREFEEKENE